MCYTFPCDSEDCLPLSLPFAILTSMDKKTENPKVLLRRLNRRFRASVGFRPPLDIVSNGCGFTILLSLEQMFMFLFRKCQTWKPPPWRWGRNHGFVAYRDSMVNVRLPHDIHLLWHDKIYDFVCFDEQNQFAQLKKMFWFLSGGIFNLVIEFRMQDTNKDNCDRNCGKRELQLL